MRIGLTISAAAHVALLVCTFLMMWGLISFSEPLRPPTESIPVDMISDAELSQIMAGAKTAPKADAPKPVVDKVAAETKPVKDPTPKVSDKPEIQASAEAAPPPEPKPPEPRPEKAETKPDKVAPPVDEIAEALKRDEAKKKAEAQKLEDAKKKEEAKKRLEAKKREQQQKFDTAQIDSRLALLDKRAPQRQAATGAALNPTPSLGAPNASAATMSMSEFDALIAHLHKCWDVPAGVKDAHDIAVLIRIQFKKDGSLMADPVIINQSPNPTFRVAAESALRAIRSCAPYNFMPTAKYEAWKEVEVNFDPRDM